MFPLRSDESIRTTKTINTPTTTAPQRWPVGCGRSRSIAILKVNPIKCAAIMLRIAKLAVIILAFQGTSFKSNSTAGSVTKNSPTASATSAQM